MSPLLDARALIDELAAINPKAVELAVVVCLASRIEPELLRAARLDVVGSADAAAEADLWLSPLMSSRSVLFAVMRPSVADELRQRLAADKSKLDAAWRVLSRVHEHAPRALRVEEEITWRVLANPEDTEIGRLFTSVLSAMESGRPGLARWAARALPRLPQQARQTGPAWLVSQKAAEMLGGPPILGAELTRQTALQVSSPFPVDDLPKLDVGLHLYQDALRISQPPIPGGENILVPHTTPLVLELEWRNKDAIEHTTVTRP
jgi:hypothetical protein